MNENILSKIPPMKSGNELVLALSVFPEYDETICNENEAVRLMALSELYKIYVPSQMSLEIYNKLYLALLRSLQKKGTRLVVVQHNENHKAILNQEYRGIIGGSDSFTIIGASEIGKSSAISRAIALISESRIIEIDKPYTKIIPCVVVQTPFDSSVKGLLLEILRKVDEELESNYYKNALKVRTTTDMLIGMVSSVAMNHIGLLIVDEIQNVVNSKNGKNLIGSLTQLINNSGISICMVGTPESTIFFEQAMHLARRSLGLKYTAMCYDAYFQSFCKVIFNYQYVKNRTEITAALIEWLYEHSAGVVSVVVSLIHDAQEIAILTGKEVLNLETLNMAYEQRMSMLHGYIQPSIKKGKSTTNTKINKNVIPDGENEIENKISISSLVEKSKSEGTDIVKLFREHMSIEEVLL